MNDGTFELNKAGYYTPQQVAENDFLNGKLTSDQYGKWYSVQFVGDAETYLWQTKTDPVKGQKYFGMLIKTTSGKAVKFKRLKEEDYNVTPEAPTQTTNSGSQGSNQAGGYWDEKQKEIRSAMAVKTAAQVVGTTAASEIESFARELYDMVDRVKVPLKGYEEAKATRAKLDNEPPLSDNDDPGWNDDGQPDLL